MHIHFYSKRETVTHIHPISVKRNACLKIPQSLPFSSASTWSPNNAIFHDHPASQKNLLLDSHKPQALHDRHTVSNRWEKYLTLKLNTGTEKTHHLAAVPTTKTTQHVAFFKITRRQINTPSTFQSHVFFIQHNNFIPIQKLNN